MVDNKQFPPADNFSSSWWLDFGIDVCCGLLAWLVNSNSS
jgi:hypothetical protein